MTTRYTRYDIARKVVSKRIWHPFLMVCHGCAKKLGILDSFLSSDLCSLADEDSPCMTCGDVAGLSEVEMSFETYQKART